MIFFTGGTGFLGNAIISQILQSYPDERIAVLVRGGSEEEAKNRLHSSFSNLKDQFSAEEITNRLLPIKGNLDGNKMGISERDYSMLEGSVSSIYHSAANTHLGLDYDESYKINYEGTVKVLDLAKRVRLNNPALRFNHISTAYVAGDTSSVVSSDRLELSGRFRNSYEETKARSEDLVRSYKDDFNVVVFRPSIIVGNSKTGVTSAFNVLYIPARIIITGLLKVIPALPHIPFDVVPVDYVAESISSMHKLNILSGSSFHLSAGLGRESSPGEVLDLLFHTAKNFGSIKVPQKPNFVPPEMLPDMLQRAFSSVSTIANNIYHTNAYKQFEKLVSGHVPVFKQLLPFLPYMISNPRFDTSLSCETLNSYIKPAPLFSNYAENIFSYCLKTQWGKVPASI